VVRRSLLTRLPVARVLACAGVASLLLPARAWADGAQAPAMAETLFLDGRTLMSAGKYAEACPKFAESNKIDPKLGTLLNLALCHEMSGMTASAWGEYTQAAELAHRAGQSDRESVARDHATKLEPGLLHVVVRAAATDGLVVSLDGQPVGPAAFGSAMPIDPGPHRLVATAPGRAAFETSFRADAGAGDRTVEVPALAVDTSSHSTPPPAEATQAHPAPEAAGGSSGTRTVGFLVGGAGVVLLGVGSFFGVRAFSDKNTAENDCTPGGRCGDTGNSAKQSLSTDEAISTVGVLAGIAAVGVGGYLVLAGGSKEHAAGAGAVRVGIDPIARRLDVRWTW
jgi:hypothetical protein